MKISDSKEHRIPIGKPKTPPAVEYFRKVQNQLTDTTAKKSRTVFAVILGILALLLIYFLCFHTSVNPPVIKEKMDDPATGTAAEELEKREHFTAETVRSLSGLSQSDTPDSLPEDRDMNSGGGMEILKNTGASYSAEIRAIPLPPATVLEAHLDGKIIASQAPVPVVAFVDQDFEDNGKVLVPAGTKLLGQTAGIQGKDRVLIRFDKIVMLGGRDSYDLLAVAVDQDKAIGLPGEADQENVYQLGTSFASTMVGLGMDSVMSENQSFFGELARQTMQNSKEGLSSAMGQNNYATGQGYTVTLPVNMPIRVLVTQGY